MVVEILRVFDLEGKDLVNNDTYCKCSLMPDKLSFNTRIAKKSTNPIYEDTFEFDNLEMAKLDSRYLEISVFELDKQKEDCLGTTYLKLNYPTVDIKKIFLKDLKSSLRNKEVRFKIEKQNSTKAKHLFPPNLRKTILES